MNKELKKLEELLANDRKIIEENYKEIERLKTLWEADRQNWACIMYEKEKEIDKLKNNKPDLTNFIKLETAKLNRKREQEKNKLYRENLLLKNDVERLHSIIKEVREYIDKEYEENCIIVDCYDNPITPQDLYSDILKILDKGE